MSVKEPVTVRLGGGEQKGARCTMHDGGRGGSKARDMCMRHKQAFSRPRYRPWAGRSGDECALRWLWARPAAAS